MLDRTTLSIFGITLGVCFLPLAAQAATLGDYPLFAATTAGEYAGYAASSAGDVNGDGYDDFLVGAYNKSSSASGAGAVYLVYGNATDLAQSNILDSITAVEFTGQTAGDYAGYAVAGGGDVNNDGFADILVGAYGYDNAGQPDTGRVYLIYGSSATLSSQSLGSTGQVVFTATVGASYLGRSVAFAGDINGDGYDDMVFGASGYLVSSGTAGAAFVVYGSATTLTSKTITDANIIQLSGEAGGDTAGWSVNGAGDVNGDGYDDFLVGAYGYTGSVGANSGTAYLVYGRAASLTAGSLSTHTRFAGESAGIQLGFSVDGAGDVNGDGYDDVLLGAPASSAGAANAGAVYLLYGGSANFSSVTLTSSNSARLMSLIGGESLGISVSTLGDVNQDGYAEFFMGAPSNDSTASNVGMVYFLQGSATAYTSTDMTSLLASSGEGVSGNAIGDNAGQSLAAVGDRNNNGTLEVLVGAYNVDAGLIDAGAVYLLEPFVDADGDGGSSEDSLLGVTDCNDADATVVEMVTYYEDQDGDGEGNSTVSVSQCSSVAPEGYVDNDTDTDDTIANNGIEISGNERDDDDDGVVDEVNTLKENGVHPGYGEFNPKSKTDFADAVVSITPKKKGRMLVKYADDSIFRYNIFPAYTGDKKTVVKSYRERGFVTVLHPKGKQIKLVNIYTGKKLSTKTLSKQATYAKHSIKNLDVRNDDVIEVVVISKKKTSVRLSVLKVNMKKRTLKLYDTVPTTAEGVVPRKTSAEKKKILLKNSAGQTILKFLVSADYLLQQE